MTRFALEQTSSLTSKPTRLRAMANNAIKEVMAAQEETVKHIIEDLIRNYDTAEPGESYERTYNMAGSWSYQGPYLDADGSIKTVIFNMVEDEYGRHYSGIVQGDAQTFRHEEAGWHTLEEIRTGHLREQTNRVRSAIRKAGGG